MSVNLVGRIPVLILDGHGCTYNNISPSLCITVEPPNKGHLGTRASVLYSEVSFIWRFEMY